ncbi:MAG: helix-turn-helix domain-containing protein [Candidatus Bathyarchaeia archaeon]
MNRADKNSYENEILILFRLSRRAESRKKILKALRYSSKNCSQIAREVGLDWWTVQKHLCTLRKENIVKSSDFGNSKFYRLTSKGEDVIKALLSNDKDCF